MAPTKTTTVRVPSSLRDEIARLADESNTSMAELLGEAIEVLKCQRWWDDVHASLDDLDDGYRHELSTLDTAAGDGLGD
jgi:predicted transcriptional regulator